MRSIFDPDSDPIDQDNLINEDTQEEIKNNDVNENVLQPEN